jgi:response regulator RpfG family c-di-GMP phosphodiesterase
VCNVLVKDGLLKKAQSEAVLREAEQSGERVEEYVLMQGLVSEADLLKSLAAHYRTYFVSTEKLATSAPVKATLGMIPRRFAETKGVYPVMFDPRTMTLSIVTADPSDDDILRGAQMASGAKAVKAFVARPAAVQAAIQRGYAGDARAFHALEVRQQLAFAQNVQVPAGQGRMISERAMTAVRHDPVVVPPSPAPPAPLSVRPEPPPPPSVRPAPLSPPPPPPPPVIVAREDTLELFSVLISLLEGTRADLHGHSVHVARLARRVAERMRLDEAATNAIVVASYIHDLGKMGQFHLTALNVAEYDGHKVQAQKTYFTPVRLLEPAKIAKEALLAVQHMYERWDGKGFPDGQAGKDIPMGSRILSIADTYADLTQNPRNPFRKTLPAEEACAALEKHKEAVFDPTLVDLMRHIVMGEKFASRFTALMVDADAEETTVLELRMLEQGFVVKTAKGAEEAKKILAEDKIDVVVSELELAQGDGLALLQDARKESWGKNLPWVVYTRRQDRASAQKAFECGVLDFVAKPAPSDLFVAKLKAMMENRAARSGAMARGVSGSLKEMGLPDILQVLFHGRKSGNLKIRGGPVGSGEVHLADGNIVNAVWGEKTGEDAFYAMLKVTDGDFSLDPSFKSDKRLIHQSTEALLLEGLRRLDEGLT